MKIFSSFSSGVMQQKSSTPSFKARFVKNDVLDDMFDYMGTNEETQPILNRLASECPNDRLQVESYNLRYSRYNRVLGVGVKNLDTGKYTNFMIFAHGDYPQQLNDFFERIIIETKRDDLPYGFWSTDKKSKY